MRRFDKAGGSRCERGLFQFHEADDAQSDVRVCAPSAVLLPCLPRGIHPPVRQSQPAGHVAMVQVIRFLIILFDGEVGGCDLKVFFVPGASQRSRVLPYIHPPPRLSRVSHGPQQQCRRRSVRTAPQAARFPLCGKPLDFALLWRCLRFSFAFLRPKSLKSVHACSPRGALSFFSTALCHARGMFLVLTRHPTLEHALFFLYILPGTR